MPENAVGKEVYEVRERLIDERFSRDKERIDRLEKLTEEVSKCNIQLSQMLANYNERLQDHEKRIDDIEHRPIAWQDKLWAAVTSSVVALIVSLLSSGVLVK